MSKDQPADMATPTMAELHAKLEIINNAAWRHADNSDNFDLERSIEKGYQDIADALDELERAWERIAALEAREAQMRVKLKFLRGYVNALLAQSGGEGESK